MRRPAAIVLALALAAGGLAWYAWRAPAPPPAGKAAGNAPVPVVTAPVEVGTVALEVPANGTVEPIASVSVRPRVDGQIETVHVAEGALVKAGDLLFALDTTMARAQLAQLEADLERDRAQLTQAQADAARYERLVATGAGARQQADQARAQALALAATVKADEAQLAQAGINLSYAEIRAEINGRLGAIPIKAGNYIRAADNTVLATITRIDPIRVRFAIPERYIPQLRAAWRARDAVVLARAPDDPGEDATGKLVFINNEVDATTGTIMLKGEFANPERRLWPGQFVTVRLRLQQEPGTITVPAAAVQLGQNDKFVFVATQGGRAERRPVKLLRVAGGRAVVTGALTAGERVVVDGARLLVDGAPLVEHEVARAATP